MLIGTGIWCTVCYIHVHKSNPQVIILVLTFQPYGVNQYGPVVKYTTQDVDGNTISGTGRIYKSSVNLFETSDPSKSFFSDFMSICC